MARADRDQQSNRTADRAQTAGGGGGRTGSGQRDAGRRSLNTGVNSPDSATRARDPNGPGNSGKTTDGSGQNSNPFGALGPLGGGTTTSPEYTPGAVGNFPDANAAAVADMLSSAIPGMGLTNMMHKGVKALTDDGDPLAAGNFGPLGDALGADTGPQRGWQPDKSRGEANLTGIGADGGAVNSGDDERVIPGRSVGAGTAALTGDDVTEPPLDDGIYSDDIVLQDRRRPRALGAGTQMLIGAR